MIITLSRFICLFISLVFLFLLLDSQPAHSIEMDKQMTISDVGAAQGISTKANKFYIYGDLYRNGIHTGVIRELDKDLKPTGKVVWLTKSGKPVLHHPTGLSFHAKWGCVIGDTFGGAAKIYQLNWDKMWRDGNLDNAILTLVEDDLAHNGSRPEFVQYKGKDLIATADYGNHNPQVRLYDPEYLFKSKKSSAKGVLVSKADCGPYNQNLHWDSKNRRIVLIQNIEAGVGWRLDVIDIEKLFLDGIKKARIANLTIKNSITELEGFRPWQNNRGVFVTSHERNNLSISKPLPKIFQ